MRQRPEPDWTIAVFDREGTVIARSRDNEQFVGRPASPSLYADLMNRFEGALDTTTFDGTVVLSGFTHAPLSGWSAAVGIRKSSLTIELWRSVAVLAAFRNRMLGIWDVVCGALSDPARAHRPVERPIGNQTEMRFTLTEPPPWSGVAASQVGAKMKKFMAIYM